MSLSVQLAHRSKALPANQTQAISKQKKANIERILPPDIRHPKEKRRKSIMNPPEIIRNKKWKTPLSLLFISSPLFGEPANLPTNQPLLPIKSSPELMPWFHHFALQDCVPDDILAVFWSYSCQPDPL